VLMYLFIRPIDRGRTHREFHGARPMNRHRWLDACGRQPIAAFPVLFWCGHSCRHCHHRLGKKNKLWGYHRVAGSSSNNVNKYDYFFCSSLQNVLRLFSKSIFHFFIFIFWWCCVGVTTIIIMIYCLWWLYGYRVFQGPLSTWV